MIELIEINKHMQPTTEEQSTREHIEKVIENWSNTISSEISERTFYNKDEVAAYANAKLRIAISDCLTHQCDPLEEKRNLLAKKYANPNLAAYQKQKLQAELTEINRELKQRRRIMNNLAEQKSSSGVIYIDPQTKGRLIEVSPVTTFRNSASRTFIAALSFNRKNPYFNESNHQFILKNENCGIIDEFSKGDIICIRYRIVGDSFERNGKQIYINNLVVTNITKEQEDMI